jgi:hypothetical protein
MLRTIKSVCTVWPIIMRLLDLVPTSIYIFSTILVHIESLALNRNLRKRGTTCQHGGHGLLRPLTGALGKLLLFPSMGRGTHKSMYPRRKVVNNNCPKVPYLLGYPPCSKSCRKSCTGYFKGLLNLVSSNLNTIYSTIFLGTIVLYILQA